MELSNYWDSLEFIDEYQLSKEALIADVLVIVMKDAVAIEKNIGKIFRKHNIFEYKSETAYVSIKDYYKIIAYGCLYMAFNKLVAGIDQITLTFVEYKEPLNLFKHLREERGLAITRPFGDGIYYIAGELFPIQFVIINESLPEEEYTFLRNLRSRLGKENLINIYNALQ